MAHLQGKDAFPHLSRLSLVWQFIGLDANVYVYRLNDWNKGIFPAAGTLRHRAWHVKNAGRINEWKLQQIQFQHCLYLCFLSAHCDSWYSLPRAKKKIHFLSLLHLQGSAWGGTGRKRADLFKFQYTWHFGDTRRRHQHYTAFAGDESAAALLFLLLGGKSGQRSQLN